MDIRFTGTVGEVLEELGELLLNMEAAKTPVKRKRRSKTEIEADKAAAEAEKDDDGVADEPDEEEPPKRTRRRRSTKDSDDDAGDADKPARSRRSRRSNSSSDDEKDGDKDEKKPSRRRRRSSKKEEAPDDDEISDADLAKAISGAAEVIGSKGAKAILGKLDCKKVSELHQDERQEFLDMLNDAILDED